MGSSRVEKDNKITLKFNGMITNYEKRNISRFIAKIGHINANW